MVKLISILSFITFAILLIQCDDEIENDPVFNNTSPGYVEFTSPGSDIEVDSLSTDTMAIATVQTRTALSSDVMIAYSVSGDIEESGTATISGGKLQASISVLIDNSIIDGGEAVITIDDVDSGLIVGRGTNETVSPTSHSLTWSR